MKYEYDIFISYSSNDKAKAKTIADKLCDSGLNVWFDDYAINFGDDIYSSIEKGLDSSRILAICMSPSFFGSEWAEMERNTALFRDPTNKGQRFVTLLIRKCNIPDSIKRFKYIDLTKNGGMTLLVNFAKESVINELQNSDKLEKTNIVLESVDAALKDEFISSLIRKNVKGQTEARLFGNSAEYYTPTSTKHPKHKSDPKTLYLELTSINSRVELNADLKSTAVELIGAILSKFGIGYSDDLNKYFLIHQGYMLEPDIELQEQDVCENDSLQIGYMTFHLE